MQYRLRRLAGAFGGGRFLALACLLFFVVFRIWDPAVLETIRLRTFDFYQLYKPRVRADLPVTIIDIDEKALNGLGQWPWPRTVVSDLLQTIHRAGGIAVGFDVIFAEPDRLSPDRFGRSIPRLSIEAARELGALENTDEAMAATMGSMRVGKSVV